MATKSGQTGLAGEDTRNYGLDILKILSMVYVVILHALGQGGMMNKGTLGMQFAAMALFYITTPAVNIFALVTGYVSFTEKKKPLNRKRLFEMWFQVVFYALLITAICRFVIPDVVTTRDFVSSVMPLYYDIYWYFTAYFLVSVLSPFIGLLPGICLIAVHQRCSEGPSCADTSKSVLRDDLLLLILHELLLQP